VNHRKVILASVKYITGFIGIEGFGMGFGLVIGNDVCQFYNLSLWWLIPSALFGGFLIMQGAYCLIAGHLILNPFKWVRLTRCYRAYISHGRVEVQEWCREHCKGAWLISAQMLNGNDEAVISFNRKSDYAMLKMSHFEQTGLEKQ